jgi:hypothetical protein
MVNGSAVDLSKAFGGDRDLLYKDLACGVSVQYWLAASTVTAQLRNNSGSFYEGGQSHSNFS